MSYIPEMGQLVFGNEWGELEASWSKEGLFLISMAAHEALGEDPDMLAGIFASSAAYGIDFSCEIFEMHKYWWGDEDASEASRPNFIYKLTGLELRWYKYIGRGMSSNCERPQDWDDIVNKCTMAARLGV